ncbi:hypothetical protein MAPG_09120 [Magnaporthiopsis poae ATCC 64411]|uniref:Uncharacterized protein n=1 Tax=Magnaporthiopsis poae (strain ATCC 64411 / 73-15) TaxID=644358 RepID=A0A0C4E943_MAGP6|nr:hypothetical protein MAPG_09120 [Magnaporthiopsis poae ATCC 64411]
MYGTLGWLMVHISISPGSVGLSYTTNMFKGVLCLRCKITTKRMHRSRRNEEPKMVLARKTANLRVGFRLMPWTSMRRCLLARLKHVYYVRSGKRPIMARHKMEGAAGAASSPGPFAAALNTGWTLLTVNVTTGRLPLGGGRAPLADAGLVFAARLVDSGGCVSREEAWKLAWLGSHSRHPNHSHSQRNSAGRPRRPTRQAAVAVR